MEKKKKNFSEKGARQGSLPFPERVPPSETSWPTSFADLFCAVTGHPPFPWQSCLYKQFTASTFPSSASIPTGLGKTSVVAVWLIALALHPDKVPRRLVYVVNRRTVVDQTTAEVESLRKALMDRPELIDISNSLRQLCSLPLPSLDAPPLAISTLRGQFADNREWSADPARPAVIIGTVDMIGSGLLFSRYTVGFKLRPHHAAFLAQDVLLVHDEAHLEPAFQKLLDSIVEEQSRSNDPRKLRVMELSATTRSGAMTEPLFITEDDKQNDFVHKRLNAVKNLSLVALGENEKEQDKLIELALACKESGRAILVFVRLVEAAVIIASEIAKKAGAEKVVTLTGTMRGRERDELVARPVFQRFLPNGKKEGGDDGTVWLVATSAGEVGVNISADDLICDVSTYESMAQRFGRVNRFGERDDSAVWVVYPAFFGKTDRKGKMRQSEIDIARERTLELLQKTDGDVSPAALERLPADERAAAFSPLPRMRTATAIQFDAWALTSIRKPITARPPVAPYLHGESDFQPPETHLAWRDELDKLQRGVLTAYPPEDLLEDFPLKPHELLRDTSKRIAETLSARIERFLQERSDSKVPEDLPPGWLLAENGFVRPFQLITSDRLFSAYKNHGVRNSNEKTLIKRHIEYLESALADGTLILPASLGGISEHGLFTADARFPDNGADVSGIEGARLRLFSSSPDIPNAYAAGYRLIRAIDTRIGDEAEDLESPTRYWLWLEARNTVNAEKRSTVQPETLASHTRAIVANVAAIAGKLLPANFAIGEPDLHRCLRAAAEWHDVGKNRRLWQVGIGNTGYNPENPDTVLAKSSGAMRPRQLAENYRHEFGSLHTAMAQPSSGQGTDILNGFSSIERDIVLHLVAAHHGRARPHFPVEEVFDYDCGPYVTTTLAAEIPNRFARLQYRFGRWGLAWLESILRAADYAASAGIVATDQAFPKGHNPGMEEGFLEPSQKEVKKTITLRVDVANPGQFFACCGLFDLASRRAPDALAHFEQDGVTKQWHFFITGGFDGESAATPMLSTLLEEIAGAEVVAVDPEDTAKTVISIKAPFNLVLDWWRYEGGPMGKLKTWAGQMSVCSIARDMQQALKKEITRHAKDIENILFVSTVGTDGQPYYFDANYAVNAQAQDVGFSVDKLGKGGFKLKTATNPAVELLCLIGLQRARPLLAVNEKGKERLYEYRVWDKPLACSLLPAAIAGVLPGAGQRLRFANPSRAKDYRAFMPSVFQ